MPTYAPTDKQINFATKLGKERVLTADDAYDVANLDCLDRKQVSNLIDRLMKAPKVAAAAKKPFEQSLEVGIYKCAEAGTLFRVYKGKQSGMNLVKQVIPDATGYSYEYIGSAFRVVSGTSSLGKITLTPITKEEAANWGHLTGSCIICGRHLDDPDSVDAGIGPVCAKGF